MECGTCTLCCKLAEMPWVNSPAGKWCEHCEIGKGCKIWGEHPGQCKQYFCMWAQMDKASLDLRPDRCGVIFEKVADDLITTGQDANPKNLTSLAKRQIQDFMNQGFSVAFGNGSKNKTRLFLGKGKNRQDVFKRMAKVKEEWQHTQQT